MDWLMNLVIDYRWRRLQKQVAATWAKADIFLASVSRKEKNYLTVYDVYNNVEDIFSGKYLYCERFLSLNGNCLGCPLVPGNYCSNDDDKFASYTLLADFQKVVKPESFDIRSASELAHKISVRVSSFSNQRSVPKAVVSQS